MKTFAYDVTRHPSSKFTQVAFFCGQDGSCDIEEVPGDQVAMLKDILNERGAEGWELVHLAFGRDGLLAFWKRESSRV